jgi:hypothetical protein
MVLEKESCLIQFLVRKISLQVKNANCDLSMMGDLNVMEHFNQTTEAPLLVKKARQNEEHNEILRERRRTYRRN